MAKTLRVRTATGWVTKPVEDLPENRLIAEEIDDNFLAIEAQTNLMGGFKNKIINGDFRIWQRAVSQTSHGYGSDDRWSNQNAGSTKTHSQQTHPVGEERGGSPYFSRTVVTSVAGAGNFVLKQQRIEDVRIFAGKTVTFSFDAKADAPKSIAVEFTQNFGADPSVIGIGATHFNLTTAWQRFTMTVQLPSIVGKNVGGFNFLHVAIWLDAGSDWDARTKSIGQRSGTFDICAVQLEEGPVATAFEQRPIGLEEMLCQRYYWQGNSVGRGTGKMYAVAGSSLMHGVSIVFSNMRVVPSMSYTGGVFENCTHLDIVVDVFNGASAVHRVYVTATGTYCVRDTVYYADAEL